jgi:hypothetical protein
MKRQMELFVILALFLCIVTNMSEAALFVRPGGMIYDSTQNLTWISNADLGKGATGWSETNVYWKGFQGYDRARSWVNNLVYGGYDDWRLSAPGGGELVNLFNDPTFNANLFQYGIPNRYFEGIKWATVPTYKDGKQNGTYTGNLLFVFSPSSKTEFPIAGGDDCWSGWLGGGAWAVRNGDVNTATPTPIPAAVWLFGSGLVGLVGLKKRRAKK